MKNVAVIAGMFGVLFIVAMLISYPVMLLWNYCLVPAVPALQQIGWLQSLGIIILVQFLTKTTVKTKE